MRWWPEPTAGDIAWCHFPDNIHPKPKPRPGLITSTKEDDDGRIFVSVAYGTSQKTDRLYSGEFRITKGEHPAAYASAGLSWGNWEVTLFVKNLNDNQKIIQRPIVQFTANEAYRITPRTIGISLSGKL